MEVCFLHLRRLPNGRIPFIYDRDELAPRQGNCRKQCGSQGFVSLYLRILCLKLLRQSPPDKGDQPFFPSFPHDVRHIQINHVVLIQVPPVAVIHLFIEGNLQIVEQHGRIAGSVIVSAQHLGRKGFAETAGAADTGQLPCSLYGLIHQPNQAGFIHIPTVSYDFETAVSRI